MGITTKIFIVLNLIVALFTGLATFVVFGKQTYWVDQTRQAVDAGNLMYKELKTANIRLEADLKGMTKERDQMKVNLDSQKAELDKLKTENSLQATTIAEKVSFSNNLKDTITQREQMLSKVTQRNEEIQQKLDESVRKESAAQKENEWHQSQAIESAADLREAENQMTQLAKNNSELVRKVTVLSTQLEKYVQRYGSDPATGNQADVAINGRVMQIEPSLDLVILSVGEKDKVAKGMEFVISRGDSYIAKVRVANVYDNMCSARIINGMTKAGEQIKISDSASTLN